MAEQTDNLADKLCRYLGVHRDNITVTREGEAKRVITIPKRPYYVPLDAVISEFYLSNGYRLHDSPWNTIKVSKDDTVYHVFVLGNEERYRIDVFRLARLSLP